MDEVLHDKEVISEAGFFDHADLVFKAVAHLFGLCGGRIFIRKALFDKLAHIGVRRFAIRLGEFRQKIGAMPVRWDELKFYVTALRDLVRACDGLRAAGDARKLFRHRFRREDGKIVGLHRHSVVVGQLISRLHGKEHIVILSIFGVRIVAVLRGDERDAGFFRKLHEHRFDLFRFRNAGMFLDLQKIIFLPEYLLMFQRDTFCFLVAIRSKRARHLAAKARGKCDEPFVIFAQQVFVHARFIIEPLKVGF